MVHLGDTREQVRAVCGAPIHRFQREQELTVFLGPAVEQTRFLEVAEWLYNFGPNRLMALLTFEGDDLRLITHRGYGFPPGMPRDRACTERLVGLGDTLGEVLLKCGEPDRKEHFRERTRVRLDSARRRGSEVEVDEWVYDVGGGHFPRTLLFRNNRLVEVVSGETERD